MTGWIPSRDDREPFVLPVGRTILIKYTLVVSPDRPEFGRHGLFQPEDSRVLWHNGIEQKCLLFGGSRKALTMACEEAAILPCGPQRQKAHEAYLRARKFLWSEMTGRVVSVEDDKDPQGIWVVGVEETSSIDFEIMLNRHRQT